MYSIDYYCASHVGYRRHTNQDNYICRGDYMPAENGGTDGILRGQITSSGMNVFGVFDGMGGEEQGEMAAYIAASTCSEFAFGKKPEQALIAFCKSANERICDYVNEHSLTSMGTTAAMLLFTKKRICLCNIGDSKIFRFSKNTLGQISFDHVAISAYGTKPPLTQNLGIPETELVISPYLSSFDYHDGDVYLICSDGLTDMVSVQAIEQTLRECDETSAAALLLEQALQKGGRDNITLQLLYIKKTNCKLFNLFNR